MHEGAQKGRGYARATTGTRRLLLIGAVFGKAATPFAFPRSPRLPSPSLND